MYLPLRPALVPLALVACLASCTSFGLPGDIRGKVEQPEKDVAYFVRRGRFAEAVLEAERLHRKNPDDPQAAEDYRLASAAWLLERGRRELFADRDEEALAMFNQAREIAPGEPLVQDWIDNASHQLAMTWHDRGLAWQVGEDLERARECYETSLAYQPGFERARVSLFRVLLQMTYREGMSEEYYDEGVRASHELYLDVADQYFTYSNKYDPENDRTLERREMVRTELALQRVYLAEGHEANERYAAAHNEYRMALLLDEDLEIALEGLERATREFEAAELLREADRRILKKEYETAEARLAEGRLLTESQGEKFDVMLQGIQEARLNDRYEVARTLESDQQFEAAVAEFDELLSEAPYFLDAIARRDTLQSYVEEAERLYELVTSATSEEEQLRYLRRIDVFWPDYRDVRERLRDQ